MSRAAPSSATVFRTKWDGILVMIRFRSYRIRRRCWYRHSQGNVGPYKVVGNWGGAEKGDVVVVSKRYFADGHTKSRPAGRPPFSLTPWSTESTKGKDTKEMKAAGGISSDAGEDVFTLSISGFEFLCFAKLHRLLQSTS
uniref:Uncharacterized protein n=1 Tax=Daphnia galeata TaxID=27404 RepID=A0A8J2W230_9CRUS|nr:unnamed protein product [Daphnia galeata]